MNLKQIAGFDLPAPATARPTYFGGCMHFGDGGASDIHMPNAGLFRAFLRETHRPGTDFWHGGDGPDLWTATRSDILRAHGATIQEVEEWAGIRRCKGNHDWTWDDLLPVSYSTRTIWMEHGNTPDPFNSGEGMALGEVTTWFAARLRAAGITNAEEIDAWLRCLTPGRMSDEAYALFASNYLDWAKRKLDESGALLLVYFHTHRPFAVQLGDGRVILNGGSFVPPRKPTVPPHKPTVGRVDGKRVELLEVSA